MSYEFSKGTSQYAIKTSVEKLSYDEIPVCFKSKDEIKNFFSPAVENLIPKGVVLQLSKKTAPSYCSRSKAKSQSPQSDQDYLEQFYAMIAVGQLNVVQKSQSIKYAADPIGWFDWDKFFADPRVPHNFHDLDDTTKIAMIKAWQKEKSPLNIFDIFKPTKFESNQKRASGGTIGVGFSNAAGSGSAIGFTQLIVFDEAGNVGYLVSGGGGGMGGVSVSGTFTLQVTNAKDIYELKGLSTQTGASIGEGLSVGIEYITGAGYHGVNFSFGVGAGLTPAELHSIAEYAYVGGGKVEDIIAFVKKMKSLN